MINKLAKKMPSITGVLIVALVLSSCKQGILQGNSDLPATLINTTPKTRAELNQLVSQALLGLDVTLADDALTKTSLLIIERTKQRTVNNDRIMG